MSISSIGNQLEETFLSSRKRILSSVVGLILLLSIPVTLSLVYQQQDLRQRAQGWGVPEGGYDGPLFENDPYTGEPYTGIGGPNTAADIVAERNAQNNPATEANPGSGAPDSPSTHNLLDPRNPEQAAQIPKEAGPGGPGLVWDDTVGSWTPIALPINPDGSVANAPPGYSWNNVSGEQLAQYIKDHPNSVIYPNPYPETGKSPDYLALVPYGGTVSGQLWDGSSWHQVLVDTPLVAGGVKYQIQGSLSSQSSGGSYSSDTSGNAGDYVQPPQKYCSTAGIYTAGISYNCSGGNIEVSDSTPKFGRSGTNYSTIRCAESTACARVSTICVACMPVTPTPTRTPIPTPTPTTANGPTATPTTPVSANDVLLALKVFTPGVGGNSQGNNQNPVKNKKKFNVSVSSQGEATAVENELEFGKGLGAVSNKGFGGNVNLGRLPNGSYIVKVKTGNSLWKQVPGFVNLNQATSSAQYEIELVTGDLNQDNKMGIDDYNIFLNCYKNECTDDLSDLNLDGKVDLRDLNILLRAFANRQGD